MDRLGFKNFTTFIGYVNRNIVIAREMTRLRVFLYWMWLFIFHISRAV
ncbi:hypothetical protein HMPREF1705_04730 [Acetomicrobium hydrogeniformans ATCC BAA-1850]|uniref:Uncharacterized protein n=1 Tax=Acetomicrobium hydrogeniformans ATCC BAA-1850 TaxID=592015 RepID=A0A0T5X8T7_9BACT|nr:hypothetical protein HMPREF1705_04730 [Acetomicrobium hydrogeniformans ATCC BAA-1850]